jgi:acetyl esterase/lipase
MKRPFACVAVFMLSATLAAHSGAADTLTWRVDNLERIGGHAVTVAGSPRVVGTDIGPAVEFNGRTDGLYIETNPLAGFSRFTIDLVFQADADGPEEQRVLHMEEEGTENRALIEIRSARDRWALDTYLRSGDARLTLLDRAVTHPAASWHVATLIYDGAQMTHYVDGIRDGGGPVSFAALRAGRMSIGVRLNRVSWFKGRVHSIRIASEARPAAIPLWPEGVPGAKANGGEERVEDGRVTNVHVPTLTYVPPTATPNGTAIIICPGGGYARLAMSAEPAGIAPRLQPTGTATFILKYRLGEYGFPAPLQDIVRAIRMLRSRASEFGLRPDRIGVIGASAGGHVAAMAATMWDAPEPRTGAAFDSINGRPDFVALLYPVITMRPPFVHAGSRTNLLGASPSAASVDRLSLETRVRKDMPPVFVVHTTEDKSVPVENSLQFYAAMRKIGASIEMHIYERGAHGFGTQPDLGTTSEWPDRWIAWMRAHGWM